MARLDDPSDDLDEYSDFDMADGDADPEEDYDDQPISTNLQIMATSTTNPERPRTLRAGYDRKTKTMIVVFRKNVWWAYRDVPEDMWEGFKQAESKGKYLRESGLDTWADMGPANLGNMTRQQRIMLAYNVKRSNDLQKALKGKQSTKLRGKGVNYRLRGRGGTY